MTAGWYVHHHGRGHLHRYLAVREALPGLVGLSSLPRPAGVPEDEWVSLPLDAPADEARADVTAGGTLHWAPLRHDGLRSRMAAIAAWIGDRAPDVLVVDVSAEVALLARLHGVPTVLVAQRGVRDDPPHRLARASAAAIVAPWTRETHLDEDGPEEGVRFVGALSRFDGNEPSPPGDDVLVLLGAGGDTLAGLDVAAVAETTPGVTWHVAGGARGTRLRHARVVDHDPDVDVWRLLRRAAVVVGTAGNNVVAEVAAARRPFVCLPQERPFAEQERQGEALRRHGLAEVRASTPATEEWPAILARARARDPARWALLHDGAAAERVAAVVREVACA